MDFNCEVLSKLPPPWALTVTDLLTLEKSCQRFVDRATSKRGREFFAQLAAYYRRRAANAGPQQPGNPVAEDC